MHIQSETIKKARQLFIYYGLFLKHDTVIGKTIKIYAYISVYKKDA